MISLPPLAGSHAEPTWDVSWARPPDDRAQYDRDASVVLPQVVQLRRAIARMHGHREHTSRAKSSGRLDRQKLHSLAFRNPYVFRRPGDQPLGLAVALLIDESGSMKGPKIETARRVAVLFREALASQPAIDLFIHGHTADDPSGTTNLFAYWEPRQHGRKYSLGAIRARANNRDGVAIGAVAREVVRQSRHRRIVLVVMSDGVPYADRYQGEAALEHTRQVVRSLRTVHVVHVGIDIGAEGQRICDAAFSFTSLPELPRQMGRLLARLVAEG